MKLSGLNIPVPDLSEWQTDCMLTLMNTYYQNVNKDKFAADLAEKDGVLILADAHHDIRGFTTYLTLSTVFQGAPYRILYSGDTIIEPAYWGHMALFRTFAALLKTLMRQDPQPVYWFLLSKGVRTYLMLPLYFKHFYPCCQNGAAEDEANLLHHLAATRFGPQWLAKDGIVRLDPPADRLRDDLALIPADKRNNPHIRFFLDKNPGYVRGDELACLAKISQDNFTGAARRFMRP